MHLAEWRGDDFALFTYPSKWRERFQPRNDTTRLLLDFKEGDDEAIDLVATWMTRALAGQEARLRDTLGCRYIVSAPTSSSTRVNVGCERLCAELADSFDFLEHIEGGLVRTLDVEPSHLGGRHTVEDHIATIDYAGPAVAPGTTADLYCAEHDKWFRKRSGYAWHFEHNEHVAATAGAFILVDDIVTNVRTSEACRRVIQQATGAERVVCLFVGRTQGH